MVFSTNKSIYCLITNFSNFNLYVKIFARSCSKYNSTKSPGKFQQDLTSHNCQLVLKQPSCKDLQITATYYVLPSQLARMECWVILESVYLRSSSKIVIIFWNSFRILKNHYEDLKQRPLKLKRDFNCIQFIMKEFLK